MTVYTSASKSLWSLLSHLTMVFLRLTKLSRMRLALSFPCGESDDTVEFCMIEVVDEAEERKRSIDRDEHGLPRVLIVPDPEQSVESVRRGYKPAHDPTVQSAPQRP